jgi:glycine cleavage system H lipoate-binding protein
MHPHTLTLLTPFTPSHPRQKQGTVICTIQMVDDTVYEIALPTSATIVEINTALNDNTALLKKRPHYDAFLVLCSGLTDKDKQQCLKQGLTEEQFRQLRHIPQSTLL